MVELIYHPSPLEEAYGIYLLETVFGQDTTTAAAASSSSASSFSIAGRQAVPFLSQARNLGRDVLREIWSAVDPLSRGKLTDPLQFHVLLRLIALGQAGILEPALRVAASQIHQTPDEALRQCLLHTANRTDLPLAVFEGYPIPEDSALRTLYFQRKCSGGGVTAAQQVEPQQQQQEPAAGFVSSSSSSFGTSPATASAVVPSTSSSIEDAFGGLVDVPDAPLPLLGAAVAAPAAATMDPTSTTTSFGGGGWDNNNNTNIAPAVSISSSQVSVGSSSVGDPFASSRTTTPSAGAAAAADPFASSVTTTTAAADPFSPTTTTTTPSHDPFGSSTGSAAAPADDDDDDFGAFSSQGGASAGNDDVFGGFAPSTAAAAAPPLSNSSGNAPTSGGFGTATIVAGDWGALDALAAVEDAPLPSLAPPAPVSNTTVPPTPSQEEEDVHDDSFGDFAGGGDTAVVEETAPPPPPAMATIGEDSTAAKAGAATEDSFGDFGGTPDATSAAATTSTGSWGAFDALASSNVSDNAPLPATLAAEPVPQQPGAAAVEDNFGGFGSSGAHEGAISDRKNQNQSMPEVGWGAFDALAEVQDAPLPTLPSAGGPADPSLTSSSAPEQDDDFGGFVGTEIQPEAAPENVSAPAVVEDDDFGQFEGTAPSEPFTSGDAAASAATGGATDDAWGAFDALADVQDAPLPSLSLPVQPTESETQTGVVVNVETGNDLKQDEPTKAEAGWGAFDTLAGVSDAPLPNLSSEGPAEPPSIGAPAPDPENDDFGGFVGIDSQPSAAQENVSSAAVDEDNFGQFEGTVPSDSNADNTVAPASTGGAPEDTWGAFDALADIPDAPLPSLPQPASNDEDDFGQFESTVPSDPIAGNDVAPAATAGSTEDAWGAFDALAEVEDTPLPTPQVGTPTDRGPMSDPGDHSDSFGGFEGSDDVSKQVEASEGEEFGDFVGRDDAVQSSDGIMGKSEEDGLPSKDQERTGSDEFSWGALDAVAPTQDTPLPGLDAIGSTENAGTAQDNPASESDGFGDFAGVGSTGAEIQAPEQPAPSLQKAVEMERTDSAFYSAEMKPASSVGSDELFGFEDAVDAFDSATGAKAVEEEDLVADDTDDFGDFGGFEAAPSSAIDTGNEQFPLPAEAVEHKNAFESTQTESEVDHTSGQTLQDDDFGGFASFDAFTPPPPVDVAAADSQAPETKDAFAVEDSDDWDAFQGASNETKPSPVVESLAREKDMIVAKSFQLPEALRRKLDGDIVDFNDCFDANIGVESPLTDGQKDRLQRAAQLLELLSSSHSKLASTYWAQCFAVARDELSKAVQLFQEAKGFLPDDQEHVRGPLQNYFAGLREFVRVARFVTATIGDILMLEHTALLTIDTLSSSWCSIALVSEALEVETLWREVEECGLDLGLTTKNEKSNPLSTLTQIRSSRSGSCEASQLDQFTLQFLSVGKATTTSTVEWEGKPFMACTANFLAHKCAFYVVTA